eukprot:gene26365-32937_t
MRYGEGVMDCSLVRGYVISGKWLSGKPVGDMTVKYRNGDLYFGMFTKYRQGEGIFRHAVTGDVYSGTWMSD